MGNLVNIMLSISLKWETQNGKMVPLAWETSALYGLIYYVVRQKRSKK